MITKPEDCVNIVKNTKVNHRQVRMRSDELKRLQENVKSLLHIWDDEDMCCCDGGDSSVGIQPTTCEVHAIAWIVADLLVRQTPTYGTRHLAALTNDAGEGA